MYEAQIPKLWFDYVNWQRLKPFLNGHLAKIAPIVPLIGYVLLFNDTISKNLSFESLTGGAGTAFFSSIARLQLIYFGLIFVGVASFIFFVKCPQTIILADDEFHYREYVFKNYSVLELFLLFRFVEEKTVFASDDETNFDRDSLYEFIDRALPEETEPVSALSDEEIWFELRNVRNRETAISRSSEFLTAVLNRHYVYQKTRRRMSAATASILLLTGTLMLALPSLDVFISVIIQVVRGL